MNVVRIVHLSDLHFTRKKSLEVWMQVCQFINKQVEPHLVLVTGDVTDNADPAEFELAAGELARLNAHPDGDPLVYRIISGNHDRYILLGNSFLGLGKTRYAQAKAAVFTETFRNHLVSSRAPCDCDVPRNDPLWKIRVIGIDSNDTRQWFAQGYVSEDEVAHAADSAWARRERDLVIALVHHHVLPIPALEMARGRHGGLSELANVTGLLNSGILLNSLSRAHVDLVLHGHEHQRNQARFGCLDDGASNVVVLAAGSGTGAETNGNFALSRVHMNVLELHDDRTMWLREAGLTTGGTLGYTRQRQLLLTAHEIRQAKFVRRNRNVPGASEEAVPGFPRSRLKKLVRFTEQRDIEITETRTDWAISDPWTQSTRNSSGRVGSMLVEIHWTAGPMSQFEGYFLPTRGDPDRYVGSVKLPRATGMKADRITCSWYWHGGGALTCSDIDALKPSLSDPIRLQGREYAAVRAQGELESLAITVQLPFRFAPDPGDVEVLVEDPSKAGVLQSSTELRRSLDFCGRSILELRVPFPLPGHVYYVTWPVTDLDEIDAETPRFRDAAVKTGVGDKMLAAGRDVLSRRLRAGCFRVGLYVAGAEDGIVLQRAAGTDGSPAVITLGNPRAYARLAWWGSAAVAERDGEDLGREFGDDERIIAVVPLRSSDETGIAALALMRVAFRESLPKIGTEGLAQLDFEALTGLLADAARAMLDVARLNY